VPEAVSPGPRSFQLTRPGGQLAGDVWPGAGPTAVLLHSGIGDRRSWDDIAPRLSPGGRVVTYDRRGSGESPPSAAGFTHLDDLGEVNRLETWFWLDGPSSPEGRCAVLPALSCRR
jgi:pimeloyl-ACP methyl ester carboxylesterase